MSPQPHRRDFFSWVGQGLGGAALAHLLARDGLFKHGFDEQFLVFFLGEATRGLFLVIALDGIPSILSHGRTPFGRHYSRSTRLAAAPTRLADPPVCAKR